MAKDEPLSPEALEKIELPITIGMGLDVVSEIIIQVFSLGIQKKLREKYPNFKWEYILYTGPDHMIEAVRRFCPQILIVSYYWGHKWRFDASTYVNDFLYKTMRDRNKNGALKPFIVLIAGRGYQLPEQYQQNIHYDIFLPIDEQTIYQHQEDLINALVQLLPEEVFVSNC